MMIYDVTVSNAVSTTWGNSSTVGFTHYCTGSPCYTCHPTYYSYISYPTTIYVDRYQLRCPRCGEDKNWGELGKEITCKGKLENGKACKATLKAVAKSTDYEIEV